MATEKLINHSQGESIITNLGTIATNLQNVTAISPAKFGMGYAVCDTAAGTAAKTANIANYVLTEGALVTVKFTNANTASNATLNLNNTGAKPILYKGSALTTDIISAGDICTFIYSTANSGSYSIINVDALSGAGAGTVKSVGAEGGLTTDQTSGAAISTTGSVKLNLKSNTAFTATAPDPVEIENKIYPVALDASGHPAVSVPGTTYTEGTGIDITNNVIKNTGVTAVAPSDSSTGTNGTIRVTTNGTTAEVAVKGLNTAAYKDVATSIPASGADDTKVATEKAVADSISGKAIGTNSSTTNAIATFAGTDGKTLADSAVTIAKNATGVTDDDTKVPTSKAVKTYVDATATGISRYIGTITATSQLSTTAKKGDFYIVSTAWTGVHAGDEIIAETNNPAQTIDGTNWTLLHNEADTNTTYTFSEGTTNGKFTVTPSDTGTAQSVTVHGLAASAYKDVDTTPTASSTKLVESGGVASALSGKQDTLTFDGTYSASTNKAATVSTVTNAINALDVSEVTVGATKTLSSISQTDGKISATATDIQSASTSQKGLVQLYNGVDSTSTSYAATANALKTVNDKAETNQTNILSVQNDVAELQKKAVKVYTYHVNPSESDPEDAVTYLDDATGLTPAKMGASTFSYGSWANAWFLPRPCVLKFDGTVDYYLNPNDYSKKTDGTASNIDSSNSTGNVMLEFPKIWVKRVNDGNGARTVSIAPVNVDGTYKCWSNINAEDKEVDHFYLPAYNGTIHSSKMRSLSGVALNATYAPNYTRAQEVTAATANNPTGKNMWYTETWADMCLVYDLLYLMGKSLDVQRTFGQGLSSGAETAMRAYVTGTHNAKGLFYGDVSGTSTAVKVLGMENLWGCRWHGVAGLINDNGTLKVKMTYGVADGSTTVGYNTTGDGYLNYGSTYGTAGYVKKMQADNTMGYKIIETAGTDATYYCNYYYVNNSQSNYALLGGGSDSGSHCGFSVSLYSGAGRAYWHFGGALSCRPQVG